MRADKGDEAEEDGDKKSRPRLRFSSLPNNDALPPHPKAPLHTFRGGEDQSRSAGGDRENSRTEENTAEGQKYFNTRRPSRAVGERGGSGGVRDVHRLSQSSPASVTVSQHQRHRTYGMALPYTVVHRQTQPPAQQVQQAQPAPLPAAHSGD
ncbi:unnamed protein product [Calypogeia fissa]